MVLLLFLFGLLSAAALPATADPQLHELRAVRRAAVRSAALAKAEGGATFGLLVLPVDFADARFAADFDPATDLAPRLADGPAGTLGHYFGVASQGRTRLAVTLAPVISLPGQRQDYSDIGWQGNERTRRLAREALERARGLGVDFAAADGDADGEVDGVLILHAAPGLENDPDGLIVPLQFFLADPVVDRGTLARSYAVASELSTLGIWAHETAHLLGLEDRYDPGLPGNGETGPRGGLGRFSLMASGWLGTGDGTDPALPDAYSRLALGWADLASEPEVGAVVRLRQATPKGPEYFLAEQRHPDISMPYDRGIPADRLLIYHVDETLAEGQASSPTWPRHLRVQLVEADGGEELARGEDEGGDDDLFPVFNLTQRFADDTIPDARTWSGAATGVDIVVTSDAAGLAYTDNGVPAGADLRLPLVAAAVFQPVAKLPPGAPLVDSLSLELTVLDPQFGQFATGLVHTCELVRDPLGGWHDLAGPPVAWVATEPLPQDAMSRFAYSVNGGAVAAGELVHVWDATYADLDLDGDWPGSWTISHPAGNGATTWQRWLEETVAIPAGGVLACTGSDFDTATDWPDVAYANSSQARLLSAPLGADVAWLALLHSVHLELLHQGAAVDGVALSWVHVGGAVVPATPADGWIGAVDPRARHALAGAPTFAVADSLASRGSPNWRREVLPLPDAGTNGPGPWQLRLELASGPLYSDRGWLVRELAAHLDEVPESAFPVWIEGGYLHWIWNGSGQEQQGFMVERSDDGGESWQVAIEVRGSLTEERFGVPLESLRIPTNVRGRIRVIAGWSERILSRTIVVDGAPEPTLSLPRPNPCSTETSIRIDGAGDANADLGLYDLLGRRLRRWRPGGDPTTVVWQGDDSAGRRVAAGVYIFRMRAQGRTLTRKVTWIR